MFLTKHYWVKRKDCFARPAHWLDILFVAGRGRCCTETSVTVDHDTNATSHRRPANASDNSGSLRSLFADTDRFGFASYPFISDIDVIATGREKRSRGIAQGDVAAAGIALILADRHRKGASGIERGHAGKFPSADDPANQAVSSAVGR